MTVDAVRFRDDVGDRLLLHVNGINTVIGTPQLPLWVLRRNRAQLVIYTEVNGHNFVDHVAPSEVVPLVAEHTPVAPSSRKLVAMLNCYDLREARFRREARILPIASGYYWAIPRGGDRGGQPTLVDVRVDARGGLFAYLAADAERYELTQFYNYAGPLQCDPIWYQRGKLYG